MHRFTRVRRLALAAVALALAALAPGFALRAGDDPDSGLQTQLVRGDGDEWCVEARLASEERVLSQCTERASPARTDAGLSTDCPTKSVVAFGTVRPTARKVVVEGKAGDREAQLTPTAPGAPIRGFAAALHLDDFPARLRVTDRGREVAALPDPVAFCRENPDLTMTLIGPGREVP